MNFQVEWHTGKIDRNSTRGNRNRWWDSVELQHGDWTFLSLKNRQRIYVVPDFHLFPFS